MDRIMRVIRVPQTISDIKIACHDENIANVNFSILEILQS